MRRFLRLAGVLALLQADLALAEDDEDSLESIKATRIRNGSDANPEMQDFVAGVYGGSGGTYVITGNTIHTPDGPIVKAGNTYLTPRGTYVKVGNSYLRPESDGDGAVVRVFAKELYDAKLLSEEGWKRVEGVNEVAGKVTH